MPSEWSPALHNLLSAVPSYPFHTYLMNRSCYQGVAAVGQICIEQFSFLHRTVLFSWPLSLGAYLVAPGKSWSPPAMQEARV